MSRIWKKLKGVTALVITLTVLLGIAMPVSARVGQETITANFMNIRITVDGRQINTEYEPFIFQGRTYLPVRDVASAMGFFATWEGATNTVHLTSQADVPQQTVSAPGRTAQEAIVVNFNNIRIAVNGTYVVTEYEPFIFQGRTYLPVRDVANAMGFDASWESAVNTVHLTSRTGAVPDYPEHGQTQTPPQTANITIPANIVPRSPARAGGPATPAISAQRAVELARDHLISIGVTSARFNYVYMDRENGVWVWSIEFDGQGRDYEFYVNVETGAFLRAPQAAPTTGQQTTPPTTGQTTTPPSNNNWRGPGRAPANWPSSVAITPERAVEIALERVGGGTVHEVDHDFERGRAAWWIEIRHNGRVYEVKVDVQTGEIVDFERD